jgi:hypothetical protein
MTRRSGEVEEHSGLGDMSCGSLKTGATDRLIHTGCCQETTPDAGVPECRSAGVLECWLAMVDIRCGNGSGLVINRVSPPTQRADNCKGKVWVARYYGKVVWRVGCLPQMKLQRENQQYLAMRSVRTK